MVYRHAFIDEGVRNSHNRYASSTTVSRFPTENLRHQPPTAADSDADCLQWRLPTHKSSTLGYERLVNSRPRSGRTPGEGPEVLDGAVRGDQRWPVLTSLNRNRYADATGRLCLERPANSNDESVLEQRRIVLMQPSAEDGICEVNLVGSKGDVFEPLRHIPKSKVHVVGDPVPGEHLEVTDKRYSGIGCRYVTDQ